MLSILFVDDEPRILEGLRRMLWSQRRQWRLSFANNGPEALAAMELDRPDIVVSDMRMPGMDGAELLDLVRQRHPQVVRIILSGHSDPALVMKSVLPAHQFLAKPVEAETLLEVLQRAGTLRRLLDDQRLLGLVSQIESLPVTAGLHQNLRQELERSGTDEERVAELISRDMGMTATLLKLVNSAFFGHSRRVVRPGEAVGLLGLEVVRALVHSQGLFSVFDQRRFPHFSFDGLWRHSLSVAGFASTIVRLESDDQAMTESAYIAGLLHDVGKLILCTVLPEEYAAVIDQVRRENRPVAEVERERLGVTHAEAGAYLIGLWGLNQEVVTAIAGHHQPRVWSSGGFGCLCAVHAANVLEKKLCVINPDYARPEVDLAYLADIEKESRLQAWQEACRGVKECEG